MTGQGPTPAKRLRARREAAEEIDKGLCTEYAESIGADSLPKGVVFAPSRLGFVVKKLHDEADDSPDRPRALEFRVSRRLWKTGGSAAHTAIERARERAVRYYETGVIDGEEFQESLDTPSAVEMIELDTPEQHA